MKSPRRTFLHLAAGAAALPAVSRFAWAQAYPSQPVRLIVTVAAGSSPDIIARLIGQWLSERLGQPFIIENRPGGGGNIGTEAVVRATADGYTLLGVTLKSLAFLARRWLRSPSRSRKRRAIGKLADAFFRPAGSLTGFWPGAGPRKRKALSLCDGRHITQFRSALTCPGPFKRLGPFSIHGSDGQMFGAEQQVRHEGRSD
jgi:hypothetical protein